MLTEKQQQAYDTYVAQDVTLKQLGQLLLDFDEHSQVHVSILSLSQKVDALANTENIAHDEKVLANARKNVTWKADRLEKAAEVVELPNLYLVASQVLRAAIGVLPVEEARDAVIYRLLDNLSDGDTDSAIVTIDACLA